MQIIIQTMVKKFLPEWIRQRFVGGWDKDGFKKYFFNTGWIFFARIVSFVVSFFTIAIVARYLGPENYGKLSYAQSFVAIFSVFASLGIDQILYRDLIAHPEKERELLGTAFVSKLFFGLLTFIVTLFVSSVVNTDPILIWLIFIITLSLLFQPFGVIAHFFNAKVQAKYPSYIKIGVAFIIPAFKLLLVYLGKGILFFASLLVLEVLIFGFCYVYIYVSVFRHSLLDWRFSFLSFKGLISRSWPLMFASLSGYIYGRIDQVMIQQFLDSTAVGVYDIAVRFTELLGFLPGIIMVSLFPAIMNARKHNLIEYRKRFKLLALLCLGISVISALCLFILSPFLIKILFGMEFIASSSLLRIYVWSTIGTIAVMLIQNYFIAENKSMYFLFFSILGAGINLGLNMIMIPKFGTHGAAYATLITLFSIICVFLFLQKRIIRK